MGTRERFGASNVTVIASEVICETKIEFHDPEVWLQVWSQEVYDLPTIKRTLTVADLDALSLCRHLPTGFLPAQCKGVDPETFIFERLAI